MQTAHYRADVYFPNDRRRILYSAQAATRLGLLRKIGPDCNARIYRVSGGGRRLVEERQG